MRPHRATIQDLHRVDWSSAYAQPYWPGLHFLIGRTSTTDMSIWYHGRSWSVGDGPLKLAICRLPSGVLVDAALADPQATDQDLADMARWSQAFKAVLAYDLTAPEAFDQRYQTLQRWLADCELSNWSAVDTIKLRSAYHLAPARTELYRRGYVAGTLVRYGRGGYALNVQSRRFLALPPVDQEQFQVVDIKPGAGSRWYLICDSGRGDFFEVAAEGPLQPYHVGGWAQVAIAGWKRTDDGWVPKCPALISWEPHKIS